jgi:hypothetical protein
MTNAYQNPGTVARDYIHPTQRPTYFQGTRGTPARARFLVWTAHRNCPTHTSHCASESGNDNFTILGKEYISARAIRIPITPVVVAGSRASGAARGPGRLAGLGLATRTPRPASARCVYPALLPPYETILIPRRRHVLKRFQAVSFPLPALVSEPSRQRR